MAVTAIWGEFIYHDASHTPQMAGYLGMRDFVTIRTKASMQDITVARLQSKKSTDTPLPPLLKVMYCVRVSLWTVNISLA
jgi:hypothetical protein